MVKYTSGLRIGWAIDNKEWHSNSDWAPVTSCVSQASVLCPLLLIIHINDVDVELNNLISKFPNDTKIGNVVLTDGDKESLQEDLHKISTWSDRWEMGLCVD